MLLYKLPCNPIPYKLIWLGLFLFSNINTQKAIAIPVVRTGEAHHLLATNQTKMSQEFRALQQQLQQLQFEVRIAPPPQRGAYGMLSVSQRVLWVHPLAFDLGIADPVLVHEAVHAAQLCKGGDQLSPLNLKQEPLVYARPFWLRYQNIHRRDIEREAFTLQTQPDRFTQIRQLLSTHCGQ